MTELKAGIKFGGKLGGRCATSDYPLDLLTGGAVDNPFETNVNAVAARKREFFPWVQVDDPGSVPRKIPYHDQNQVSKTVSHEQSVIGQSNHGSAISQLSFGIHIAVWID